MPYFPKPEGLILSATMVHPSRWWYLCDLAHLLKLRPSNGVSILRLLSSREKGLDGGANEYVDL